MKIKDLIKHDAGFQYIIDNLELMSAAGRHRMLDSAFETRPEILQCEWQNLDHAIAAIKKYKFKKPYIDLRHCLMQLHDLHGTLASLANRTPLNEVELFEIKNLAQLNTTACGALASLELGNLLPLPDLKKVFELLDPDHTGIVNFYIYDSYDARLTPLRRELSTLQAAQDSPHSLPNSAQRISDLLAEQNEIQQEICLRLTDQLHPWADTLATALNQLAYIDCLLAKAQLAIDWGLTRPEIGNHIEYEKLFNPRLKHHNETQRLRYQPVDITLQPGVCLITGANMAGKTVLLKSVGTAQTMAQCGMYVPASKAIVRLVENIVTSVGDDQDEMNGLSSYAAEIIKISDILQQSGEQSLLVLIDEPARTTNPVEGKALVQALITIMETRDCFTLITTHYSQLGNRCRRLRVKGFVEGMSDVPLTPQNINRFIDYSLVEDQSDTVPHEALRIATILGCDGKLIQMAKENINNN